MKPAKGQALPLRVAVVGLGHELRGDDAAGIAVARLLQASLAGAGSLTSAGRVATAGPVMIVDAGPAPENYTGPLCRFQPHVVLFVDAAQIDEPPGTIRYVPWAELVESSYSGLGASTHALSPLVLSTFLIAELGCQVALIGIQPAGDAVAAPLSPRVAEAVDSLVLSLLRVLAGDWELVLVRQVA
jgi:hydrogenase 3 maturation protease